MKPYYSEDGITIYHGDCREILPTITERCALVCDPPFGTGWVRGGGNVGVFVAKHVREEWDVWTTDWLNLSPGVCAWAVICPTSRANDVAAVLPPSALAYWRKTNPRPNGPDREAVVLAPAYLPQGIEFVAYNGDTPLHPCQKPLDLFQWMLGFVPPHLVIDPFIGSGTTLEAAKNLGRQAIGIEIEERYCEIAAKRLAQRVLPFEASGGR